MCACVEGKGGSVWCVVCISSSIKSLSSTHRIGRREGGGREVCSVDRSVFVCMRAVLMCSVGWVVFSQCG